MSHEFKFCPIAHALAMVSQMEDGGEEGAFALPGL